MYVGIWQIWYRNWTIYYLFIHPEHLISKFILKPMHTHTRIHIDMHMHSLLTAVRPEIQVLSTCHHSSFSCLCMLQQQASRNATLQFFYNGGSRRIPTTSKFHTARTLNKLFLWSLCTTFTHIFYPLNMCIFCAQNVKSKESRIRDDCIAAPYRYFAINSISIGLVR